MEENKNNNSESKIETMDYVIHGIKATHWEIPFNDFDNIVSAAKGRNPKKLVIRPMKFQR